MSPHGAVAPGREIALVGIDGVGKSTVTAAIVDQVRRRGAEVIVLSWRRWLQTAAPGIARDLLLPMHGAAVRALYSDSRTRDGRRGAELLPADSGLIDDSLLLELIAEPTYFTDGRGVLASMYLEVAAGILLRQHVIEPALRQGKVVIQDSFNYKQLVKLVEIASHHLNLPAVTSERLHSEMSDVASTICRPLAGLVLVGDPSFAYQCRHRDSRGLGPLEHLGDPKLDTFDSYMTLQTASQERYRTFAACAGWSVFDMHKADLPTSVEAAARSAISALDRLEGGSGTCA